MMHLFSYKERMLETDRDQNDYYFVFRSALSAVV